MNVDLSNIEGKIVKPFGGFQEAFTTAQADVVWGVGQLGSGKSYGLVLSMAEPLMTDADFRGLISRKAIQSLKAGGGFVEKFKQIFGDFCSVKESDNPRISFPNGSFCDLTYIDDSEMVRLRERAKGWEYDVIAIDEIT